ncbi:hypothetical protein [Bifidobacterium saguinibicoloris]|uniref:hypothetical protein n=1 Tax=Bifidobacterium saguinibicoloris TaxID=2834433 RepID=UPI001C59D107|nr:hypothetical protein [Bifidobacterium saguinibicoloris]MBW3080729.1 hypothetical protein [Bifidobacterium saguinibicoloris]
MLLDMSKNKHFHPIPTGTNRRLARIKLCYPGNALQVQRLLRVRVRETPLRFDVAYFRFPQDGNGEWCGKWIEPFTITDTLGCVVTDDRTPARGQFNMRYLAYRLCNGVTSPLAKIGFREAMPGMPDSPVTTHADKLWDVLDLDVACRDGLLTDDPDESLRGSFAVIEHTTGIVLPAFVGTVIELIVGEEDAMTIRIRPIDADTGVEHDPANGYHSLNGHERYESETGYTDTQLRADIDTWSGELRRLVALRDTSAFAKERAAVATLREVTRDDDRRNA